MKRNLYIFFLSIVLLLNSSGADSFAQDRVIDSLKLALKNAKHDTTKIRLRYEIGEKGMIFRMSYWDSLASDSKQLAVKNITLKRYYLKYLASILSNIGFLASKQGDIPKALEYDHKSLKVQEEIQNKKGIALSLNNIGLIYNYQGDIPKALELYHKSLLIYEEIKDLRGIAISLNNIGYIYQGQSDIPEALEYYQKSLKFIKEINDMNLLATSINNIGYLYQNQGDIQKALEYYHKSLKIQEEIKDKQGIATSLNNIGGVYKNQGFYTKALEYRFKSLKIYEEISDKMRIANSTCNIADILLLQGKFNKAYIFALRSMQNSKELGFPDQINRTAVVLKKIYKAQHNYKAALEMYELEIQMRDSINNAETRKASIRKQFQYQYEKKATADSVKNAEEQKVKNAQLTAQRAQLKQERTQRFALYGGLFFVIGFSGFVYNRFRVTQKQKAIIEEQKARVDEAYKQLHEKNKEIMDSIHYARRIQSALLTKESYFKKHINKN